MMFKKLVLFRIHALLLFVFIVNLTPLACFLKACKQLSVHMCAHNHEYQSPAHVVFNDHCFVYSIYFRLEVKSSILLTCTTFSFLSTDHMKMNVEFTIKLGTYNYH